MYLYDTKFDTGNTTQDATDHRATPLCTIQKIKMSSRKRKVIDLDKKYHRIYITKKTYNEMN